MLIFNKPATETVCRCMFLLLSLLICRACGGVSSNDFVMQLLSTLTGQSIERPVQVEMSCLGAAFLAGLAAGGDQTIMSMRTRNNQRCCGASFILH